MAQCFDYKNLKMLDIKVLGPGCANCDKLENMRREVVTENNAQ